MDLQPNRVLLSPLISAALVHNLEISSNHLHAIFLVCGNSHGIIRKYDLMWCRQCFRSNTKEIELIKHQREYPQQLISIKGNTHNNTSRYYLKYTNKQTLFGWKIEKSIPSAVHKSRLAFIST
ncbi:uncharacterized protein [Coffea arabica]|uniref:Uncharacterized protein isoform X2 n=1 Tax=Coffea arabica TaxID=13443 RepID=A0ABM4UBG8_COFAR